MNLRKEKGITLVALIITIIILVILAAVSIKAVYDSRIVGIAVNGTKDYAEEAVKENAILDETADKLESIVANLKDSGSTDTPAAETIPETESYIGYYADIDKDGDIDGIIFADLAVGGSGTWNSNSSSSYAWEAKSGLKTYTISDETQTPTSSSVFGARQVITPSSTNGEDRFYIMALENFTTSDYTTFYWYYSAYSKQSLDRAVSSSTNDFGKGKTNTINMINDWNNNYSTYGDPNARDLWGVIQSLDDNPTYGKNSTYQIVTSASDSGKWFVPSKAEWAAFGDYVYTNEGITTSNFDNYGLGGSYWSSSQYNSYDTYFAVFYRVEFHTGGFIDSWDVNDSSCVRLAATF